MTDYSELVKALRCCGNEGCHKCPYQKHIHEKFCWVVAMKDAADAIEELQAELEKKRTADYWGCKCEKLEPKRGEWVETEEKEWDIYPFKKQTCSVCDCKIDHIFMLACMDYFDDRDTVFHYCPNCGAKMEVQE